MNTSEFSPSELRIIRAASLAGWLVAALMLAGVVGGLWTVKRKLEHKADREVAGTQAFVARVRACRWTTRPPRPWADCEAEVRARNWEKDL